MNYKKILYIFLWVILGLMFSIIIHAMIEIPIIYILISDFKKYSLGLSWADWYLIHHVGTAILTILGIFGGAWLGFIAWDKLYEKKAK